MRSLLLISLLLLLAGCGSTPYRTDYTADAHSELRPNLVAAYKRWQGVPYRWGGTTRSGVDCSGLVLRVFDTLYGVRLPRTTEGLLETGAQVNEGALRPADLVFFKTSWKDRHVGIYLGEGQFMHASSSRGVVLSSLENPYWQQHYLTSRRILLVGN